MLAIRGQNSTIVIDCGGNAIRQLQRLHVSLAGIERVILTHSHPDHTSGLPLLIEMLWLSGRRAPLPIHGPAEAVDVMQRVWRQWDTAAWKGLPELHWNVVPLEPLAPIVTGADFELMASPGSHGATPVIGVRATEITSGRMVVYGAEGNPSASIQQLAHNADILVHEATGAHAVHSTAEEAARLARAAGAKKLVLVHLSPLENDLAAQNAAAQQIFGGPVCMGEDLDRFEF
jgi:ribonuclease Z